MDLLEDLRNEIIAKGGYTTIEHYRTLLDVFARNRDYTLVLRLTWECGMSLDEICSLRMKNVNYTNLTILIPAEGYVLPRAARTIYVKDASIYELIGKSNYDTRSYSVIGQSKNTTKLQKPQNVLQGLSRLSVKHTGLKITQRSLLRGRFVNLVDSGTRDMYDILRFFGSENLYKMGIMNMDTNVEESDDTRRK